MADLARRVDELIAKLSALESDVDRVKSHIQIF